MKKTLLSFLIFTIFYFLLAINVKAAGTTECVPIYGGGVSCPEAGVIVPNKTVQNPVTKAFVDNLSSNDPKFGPNQTVLFKISVTNTGNKTVSNITVTDVFPPFIVPTGQTTFTIDRLNPNESKTIDLSGKVVADNQLTKEIDCDVTNRAIATAESKSRQDEAKLCIQKQVLGVTKGGQKVFPAPTITQAPSTGPEILGLIALLPTGIAGFLLRKKAIK